MTSTLHSPTFAIPDGSPGIEREIVEPRRRTLAVTAFATLAALAAFTTSPATMTQTVASLGGGRVGVTWGLSAMGLGLAAALLPLGALASVSGALFTGLAVVVAVIGAAGNGNGAPAIVHGWNAAGSSAPACARRARSSPRSAGRTRTLSVG
jgi:hypothetical protein